MQDARIVPDPGHSRGFRVVVGGVSQSWVDPGDPMRLEFEYVQRIADMLDVWVVDAPRPPVVLHIGGGGMTLPRYLAAVRPDARQVVCKPDADQVAEVLRRAPLPAGEIEIVTTDGRSCLAARADAEFDVVIVDAFAGLSVPAELATLDFFAAVRRVLTPAGQALVNVAGKAPFAWERRYVAGLRAVLRHTIVTVEPGVWKGRRFGNLVVYASAVRRDPADLHRRAAAAPFGYTVVAGRLLDRWVGAATGFTEPVAQDPPPARLWFS